MDGVDHARDHVLDAVGVERAGLGEQPAALGHDVGGADAALDRADVRGRLLVDPAVRHRGDGVRGGEDRAAAVLGPDAGVRGAAVELGARAGSRSATPITTSPIGVAWSNT